MSASARLQPLIRPAAGSRLRVVIRGAVQGVGFRPFIFRLAESLGLAGWVNNSSQGVFIEVEGRRDLLDSFLLRIEREKPPLSFIQSLEPSFLDTVGYAGFDIRPSNETGAKTALVSPDVATCADCLREILDPGNRRFRYPFTNCTNCGPRFTIIEGLPYDRPNTTMRKFVMCGECMAEYENPLDRRFHAQPNACPACGPHLELLSPDGEVFSRNHWALAETARSIRSGRVAAIKGLGGFHLMVDAGNDDAVARLRARKHREEKPLALMYPDLTAIRTECEVSKLEERLLLSPESPIVLLRRKISAFKSATGNPQSAIPAGSTISNPQSAIPLSHLIAPGNPYLGVMLPYTPLHHLLMRELGFPVVAASGKFSDEPICTDEIEALERLSNVADLFLVHDRPITRHADDSIVRIVAGREMVLRRARGYAPLPVRVNNVEPEAPPIIAVGAHLDNAVAASDGNGVFVNQHIGDLETVEAFNAFRRVISSFEDLYELKPAAVACDMHPGYISTQYAREMGPPVAAVQHHYAHVLSCMAENELQAPVLGVSWDGAGFGLDGAIWGGEFLRITDLARRECACESQAGQLPFQRAAHLRTFRLPGGEQAIREPRRAAAGLLYEMFGARVFEMKRLAPVQAFSESELEALRSMLEADLNCPVTSSAGRLFDAVSSIVGLRQKNGFKGQAAMDMEFALTGVQTSERYPFEIVKRHLTQARDEVVVDWSRMIEGVIADLDSGMAASAISARFHNTLAESIVALAQRIGEERVALSGGCFQNKYLIERTVDRLSREGFRPYWHQRVPTNDGGIALGQVAAIAREMQSGSTEDFCGPRGAEPR